MTLNELKEQLQENLITYLDGATGCEYHEVNIDPYVIDNVCQIVVETFNNAFYAGAPTLDTTSHN